MFDLFYFFDSTLPKLLCLINNSYLDDFLKWKQLWNVLKNVKQRANEWEKLKQKIEEKKIAIELIQ